MRVDKAWVRLAPVAGRPSAGYLTVRGGSEPARIVAIDAPAAGATELHESAMRPTGPGRPVAMTMARVDGIDVAARGTVALSPGGYHLMLFGLNPALKPGGTTPLTVRFAKGPPITVAAKLVGAGDAAPD